MSALGTATSRVLSIDAQVGEVVATLGLVPPALVGAIAERNFDLMDHHRRSVIKAAGQDFPARRQAQKMIASRLHRYGRTQAEPETLEQARGEDFAAAVSGKTFGGELYKTLEFGAHIHTDKPMAIGLSGTRSVRGFAPALKRHLKAKAAAAGLAEVAAGPADVREVEASLRAKGRYKYDLVRPGGKWILVTRGRSGGRVAATLRFDRNQPKLLRFFDRWEELSAKAVRKYESDIAKALTAAGNEALSARLELNKRKASAWRGAYQQYLDANPGKFLPAKRAAAAAARAVKADPIDGSSGGRA